MKKPNIVDTPITIKDCTFKSTPATANKHTRVAVVALAEAAARNAEAIASIANALRGGDSIGIKVSQ